MENTERPFPLKGRLVSQARAGAGNQKKNVRNISAFGPFSKDNATSNE